MKKEILEQKTSLVCDLVAGHKDRTRRILIAIAGAPGSGKSTLAESVVRKLNQDQSGVAALLPMDGYHLDNRILEAHNLLDRKGAPETFDSTGFCKAVEGLAKTDETIFFPSFDRSLDLSIAGSIEISPDIPVIVLEGNYLLLRLSPWNALAAHFTASVFINPGIDALRERLQARWLRYGLDPEAAIRRAESNDMVNARLIMENSIKADLVLD